VVVRDSDGGTLALSRLSFYRRHKMGFGNSLQTGDEKDRESWKQDLEEVWHEEPPIDRRYTRLAFIKLSLGY
jgi:hypothetical protein